MVARRLSAARPALLGALIQSREAELGRQELRTDLIEFATFCLLAELCGQSLGIEPARQPLLIMLAVLSEKYRHPRILRDIAALVREGCPI